MTKTSRLLIGAIAISWCTVCWSETAFATNLAQSAVDDITRTYSIAVTDPANQTNLPADLMVSSASLTTQKPGTSVDAPSGETYLTLQASCGPFQNNFGNPTWGDFFSNMTPLPATALRYVTASGRSYASTKIDVNTRASFGNADGDDGLLDATYYFTVPISSREGTLVIGPSRTEGVQYTNFDGGSPTALEVGGPIRIALHFPEHLTVTPIGVPTGSETSVAATPGSGFANLLNFVSTVLGVLMLGFVYLIVRWRRRRQVSEVHVIHQQQYPTAPPFAAPTVQHQPNQAPRPTAVAKERESPMDTPPSTLRVNVLGALTLEPTFAPTSDPVRAILAYLALHRDRPLALEEIQNAIWPLTERGSDIKRTAMRNYMVDARKAVGEQHLPSASGKPGYQLVDADSDWDEFERLRAQSRVTDKERSLELRREALRLVRGLPFAGDTSRYFAWAFSTSVLYKIVETVTECAHDVSTALVLAGDLRGAEATLREGLLIDQASLRLWEDLTDVLLETADPSLLELHWRAAALVLRSDDVVALRMREHG
jgi:DNA-binding SARP family transcriptional activator